MPRREAIRVVLSEKTARFAAIAASAGLLGAAVLMGQAAPLSPAPVGAGAIARSTPSADVVIVPLVQATAEQLPAGEVFLRLARWTYPAGTADPRAEAADGPRLLHVETGSVVVHAADAVVTSSPEHGLARAEAAGRQAGSLTLGAGDGLLVPSGVAHRLDNGAGTEAAVVVEAAVTKQRWTPSPPGVEVVVLRTERAATLSPPPVTLTLGRATLPPGGWLPPPPLGVALVIAPEPGRWLDLGRFSDGTIRNRGETALVAYVLAIAPRR